MGTGIPAIVVDEAMAVAAVAPDPAAWTASSGPARRAASRLADLFTEDELVEGLRALKSPSSDATTGSLRGPAIVATELAIVLARASLRSDGPYGTTLRLTS